ncbi:MAG: cache domain-containing protein, partial [Gammaproteobacteria bacterium]|nr:cache domain-containing protein [Gammaproteobacteria bacterium]
MSQSPEQTAPAANAPADFVERRVRLMAILGILLTSSVIGGIATALLYKSQTNSLKNQLFFAIELQTAAMEAELARLNNIATQITSRTQIRLQLEHFLRGEISQQMLIDFTVPKLTDAISPDNGILGVTRLSPQLDPLIEVGQPIPVSLWPKWPSNTATTLGIPRDDLVVVSAPIRNRSMQVVGIDLVMFRDDRLRNIMQGFFDHIETNGSLQVATLQDGIAVHFYDIGHDEQPLSQEELKSELIEQLQLGYDEGLHAPDSRARSSLIMAHEKIGTSDWVMMFYADPGVFFSSARTHAAFAVFTVLLLAMLGIALTNRVIRPLVDRVATEARGLQR